VFSVAPIVLAASSLTIAAIVPSLSTVTALTQVGDLFTVAYLLLLGTVFLALAGLDTATAFGGMGASRAMTIAAISEPTILVSIFALSVTTGSSNLGAIVTTTLDHPSSALSPESVLAFAALVVVVVAETGRIPVDNPATHLELTMIHEAMILEYSARHLALVEWASALKLFNYSCIGIAIFVPFGIAAGSDDWIAILGAAPALVAKLALGGFALALIETLSAKMRIFRAPEFLGTAFLLAVLAMLVHQLLGS
jgi:formate hydrogenlyase subunit 4